MSRAAKNRLLWRSAGLLSAVLLLLVAVPLHAADERHLDEEGKVRLDSIWIVVLSGDSLWADSSDVDSLIRVDSLQFEERKRAPVLARVEPGFHPSYRGGWDKIRTTAKWNHRFAVAYRLADNIVVSDTTTFESQESSTTSRSSSSRTDGGGIEYLVRRGLKLSLRFRQNVDTDRPAGEKKDINDRKLNFGTSIRREPLDGLELTLTGGAGLTRREKRDEKPGSSGGQKITNNIRTGLNTRVKLDLHYKVAPGFKIAMDGNLVQGSTRIESSGNSIETSVQDDNRNDNRHLGFTLNHQNFDLAKININASAEEDVKSFASTDGDVEETTDKRLRTSFRLDGVISSKLKYETRLSFVKAERRYRLDAAQSSDRLDLSGDALLNYKLPSRISSQLRLKRSKIEDTYFPQPGDPDRTGRTDRGEVSLNLSRGIWADTKVQTSSSILLTRRVLVDSTQDKDDLTRRLTVGVDHKSSRKPIEGSATLSVNEAQSVNIHSSRSSGNQTRQTWTLTPSFVVKPREGMSIRNSYNLRLVYVFNEKSQNRNTMNRIRELRSVFRWGLVSRANLLMNYRFKVDENGSFEGNGAVRDFIRNGETSTQKLSFAINYNPGMDIKIKSSQSFEVTKRYNIELKKELQSSSNRVQIVNEVEWERTLPRESLFRVAAKQTQSAQIPTFQAGGSPGEETNRMEWEIRTSLSFKL